MAMSQMTRIRVPEEMKIVKRRMFGTVCRMSVIVMRRMRLTTEQNGKVVRKVGLHNHYESIYVCILRN